MRKIRKIQKSQIQKRKDTKKIKCYTCGKEIKGDKAISYTIPSCCGFDEIKVCKECSKKLNEYGEVEEDEGGRCGCGYCR